MPTGVFREVAKLKGRERLGERMEEFLVHFDAINKYLESVLAHKDISTGGDLVVMVVNEGEIDLFYNWVCSCRAHGISLSR